MCLCDVFVYAGVSQKFDGTDTNWGFCYFLEKDRLQDGFCVDDSIVVEVCVNFVDLTNVDE